MWFFKRSSGKSAKVARKETYEYAQDFCASRTDVEAYFEAETPREPASIMLVAHDGEWTRRKVPSLADAAKLSAELGIPLYEVARTGYPRSVREWNARHK